MKVFLAFFYVFSLAHFPKSITFSFPFCHPTGPSFLNTNKAIYWKHLFCSHNLSRSGTFNDR